MCCNRRNRNRQPLAMMAFQVAAEKNQERQEQRRTPTVPTPMIPRGTASTEHIEDKATVQPPSYKAVIGNDEAERADPDRSSLLQQKVLRGSAEALNRGVQYLSWKQQKEAEKAARKAEKWAEKARRRGTLDVTDMDDIVPAAGADKIPNNVSANAHKPASEHESRLQLLNIAQELQDSIYEFAFQGQVTITKECLEADYDGLPLLFALRTNSRQDIFRRAEETYYKKSAFRIEEKNLVPWLKKHQAHTKYIDKILVAPTNEVKENGEPWVVNPCTDLPASIQDPAMAILWLSVRRLADASRAFELQTLIWHMYQVVQEAGIAIEQDVIQVPVMFATTEGTRTQWTDCPVEKVEALWKQRMTGFSADQAELVKSTEGGDEGEADEAAEEGGEELGDAPMEGLEEFGLQMESTDEVSGDDGSGN